MKIDIKEAGAIHEDYTNLTIKILSKQAFTMWEHQYRTRASFDKASRQIQKKFYEELKRREKELNGL